MAVAALVAAAATTAHAAKLPVSSRTLFAMNSSADAMPGQLGYDAFTSATPVVLNGHLANTGQPWTLMTGTLQVSGGLLQCTTCAGSYSAAIIDADLASVTATVNVRSAAGSGAGGLILNANATGSQSYGVSYGSGTVTLARFNAGTMTVAATRSVAVPPNNVNVPLVAVFDGTTYTVSFNGAPVMTYPLPAADQSSLGSNTYFGVVIINDANVVRLDDFGVKR
jgi:hypothetical protein